MRLIDADALIEALNKAEVPYRADVQFAIDTAPTIDAVPVVRTISVLTEKGETMTDYIKREDVYDQLDRWARDLNNPQVYQRDDARCVIDGIHSADVAPVRHGHLEKNDYLFLDTLYRCSVCGEEFYLENGTPQENQYYYCPNCGAKMDGEKKNCDTCKHYNKGWDEGICDECTNVYSNWERKDDDD